MVNKEQDSKGKTTLGERIVKLAAWANMSLNEFAKEVGLSGPTVLSYINSGREPRLSLAKDIVTHPRFRTISLTWLVTGEGEMISYQAEILEKMRAMEEQLALYKKLEKANEETAYLRELQARRPELEKRVADMKAKKEKPSKK